MQTRHLKLAMHAVILVNQKNQYHKSYVAYIDTSSTGLIFLPTSTKLNRLQTFSFLVSHYVLFSSKSFTFHTGRLQLTQRNEGLEQASSINFAEAPHGNLCWFDAPVIAVLREGYKGKGFPLHFLKIFVCQKGLICKMVHILSHFPTTFFSFHN